MRELAWLLAKHHLLIEQLRALAIAVYYKKVGIIQDDSSKFFYNQAIVRFYFYNLTIASCIILN